MKQLQEFTIPFVGLALGKHRFKYKITGSFLELFDFDDFNAADVDVDLILDKKTTHLELDFASTGFLNVCCDLSNEFFDLEIQNAFSIVVKFGESFDDQNEDLLVLPHGAHAVDVAHYIYELIVLAIPQKRVHHGIEDGSLESDIVQKLQELSPKYEKEGIQQFIDPRWEKLSELL